MNEKNLYILKHWQKNKKSKHLRKTLHSCSDKTIKFLCECAVNIINGNIQFPVENLLPFEKELNILCNHSTSRQKRRQVLSTAKGIKLLQEIGNPVLLYDQMSAQEFMLIPKDSYIKKQPRALDVMNEPTAVEKAKLLTILQREPERK